MEPSISIPLSDARNLWRFLGELAVKKLIPADKGSQLASLLEPFTKAILAANPPAKQPPANPEHIPATPDRPQETVFSPIPNFCKGLKKGELKIFPHDGKLHVFGDVVDVNRKVKEWEPKGYSITRERLGASNIIHAVCTVPPHLEPNVRAMEKELEKQTLPLADVTDSHV